MKFIDRIAVNGEAQGYARRLSALLETQNVCTQDNASLAEFGAAIAQLREPRRYFPYDATIVADWLNGVLCPTEAEQSAISQWLSLRGTSDIQQEALEDAHADFQFSSPRLNEIHRSLYHAVQSAELTPTAVSQTGSGISRTLLHSYMAGRNMPSPAALKTLSKIFDNGECFHQSPTSLTRGKAVPAARHLPAIYDDILKQRAHQLWQEGVEQDQPHLLLQASRLRYGSSAADFAKGLCSNVTWLYYERDCNGIDQPAISSRIANRQKLFDHCMEASEQARSVLTQQLGYVPEPWLLSARHAERRAAHVVGAESDQVRERAEKRAKILDKLLINNSNLDNLHRVVSNEKSSARGRAAHHHTAHRSR